MRMPLGLSNNGNRSGCGFYTFLEDRGMTGVAVSFRTASQTVLQRGAPGVSGATGRITSRDL
jgi:hypothetical protein